MLTTSKPLVDKQKLADLFHFFQVQEKKLYQEQILDYFAKWDQQMVHICFSGHFSAGKSTLINHLMSESLLPQSPIPTSANIVEIKQGDNAVIVHFKERAPIEMKTLPSMDVLHQLCTNGDEVKKIEIYKMMKDLPAGITLMDTPGIDAANDADRLMTESALHQVDTVFYVMDYNHVQSEVNATFLKQLDDMHKPYYVIINQMDKHDESEISFTDFQQSLSQVFSHWDIEPTAVYYTSMQESVDTINQFDQVKGALHQLMTVNHQALLEETLSHGIRHTVQTSVDHEQQVLDTRLQQLDEKLGELDLPEESYQQLETRYNELQNSTKRLEKDFLYELEQTTKNAQLIPYEIREKAEALLAAHDPKFKVGLFKNRKKIEAERRERLKLFYQALQEKTEVSLEWKLRDKLSEFLKPYVSVTFSEAIFQEHFQPESLLKLMNEGATVNNEYLLVYCDQVSASIKKMYRQYYKAKWQQLSADVFEPINKELTDLKANMQQLESNKRLLEERDYEEQRFQHYKTELESLVTRESEINQVNCKKIEEALHESQSYRVQELNDTTTANVATETIEETEFKQDQASLLSHNNTVEDVNEAATLFAKVDGLESLRNDLLRKKYRLETRLFTIALFGAFSAGKSSFANALIGEKVLPVSPNPTTAAINKISPTRDQFKHKEILVVMKQEEELLNDIQAITDNNFQSLQDAYKWIKRTKLAALDIADQHQSFLQAIYQGYPDMEDRIGSTYIIGYNDFQRYVREESIACFVKEMELFYDCALTRQNISLVDTPGADSVNARHTDLAFSYIKNADAILFVTYYNHPFSKPDQQFLERLGSVKDAFELDKMFFIINAIDLAKDETEQQLVMNYVRKQLQQFQLTNPRMFAVSSKSAIEHKDEITGFLQFEERFYRFVKEDLAQMNMRSIYTDMQRAHGLVSNWLTFINGGQQEKEQIISQNSQHQNDIITIITNRDSEGYYEQINQKLQKQIFYVIQRLSIQFTDVFKNHIHPGAIQSNGRKGKKELEKGLDHLIKALNQRFLHEFQAIVIRLEQVFLQSLQQLHVDLQKEAKQVDQGFSFSQLENVDLEQPEIAEQGLNLERQSIDKWANQYKDSKTFFAQGGRDQLQDQIAPVLMEQWKIAVEEKKEQLSKFYYDQWVQLDQDLWAEYVTEANGYYQQIIDGQQQSEQNKEELLEVEQQITRILQNRNII
ncbi:dynamin family protein [Gracilibacillus caseinilyticus]|uniref:Dynamin family protein n=1 Tax=Gracilibacillus caseinilyticus TaxID=2932256 RepID=A0ABY4EUH4_9BACI|nr:dynamin family protein [Gracilibacillus caseinilyticus]UOQ47716.1 dynamin family protein [Gracilibacillus caseinilyticus]